jgi:hypothetical protein
VAVLLVDECECGASTNRVLADNSLSSRARIRSCGIETPACPQEQSKWLPAAALDRGRRWERTLDEQQH